MSIAFYNQQEPWSRNPGGICSYVIQRARCLGAGGIPVWWCNDDSSARWDPVSAEWVERKQHRKKSALFGLPSGIRYLAGGEVDTIEVPEAAPLWTWPFDAKLLLHWHTAPSIRGWLNKKPRSPMRDRYRHWRERRVIRLADQVLAPSVEVAMLQAGCFGLHPEKVTVIPHVFCHEQPARPASEGGGYVLMAGNLEYFKGFDLLAAAIDLHRCGGGRMKVHFAGCEGATDSHPAVAKMLASPAVKRCYARYGEEWIKFLGRLSQEELADAQKKANATVVLSRFESFSMVAGEAVRNGCPLILSDRCGLRLPAALTHGALIVDPYDSGAVARALAHVAAPSNREKLIAGSQHLAEWIASPELVARTVAFYCDDHPNPLCR